MMMPHAMAMKSAPASGVNTAAADHITGIMALAERPCVRNPATPNPAAKIAAAKMATMADGIAVGRPGDIPFAIIKRHVDAVETVSEPALSRALLQLIEHAKLVVEPAGAAAVALLNETAATRWEGPVVAVLSGGNIDPLLLLRIIRHGMAAAGRYLQFRVSMPDRPGSLARLLADCAGADANVVHVEHSRTDSTLQMDEVDISVQLETKGPEHCETVLTALRDKGYRLKFS